MPDKTISQSRIMAVRNMKARVLDEAQLVLNPDRPTEWADGPKEARELQCMLRALGVLYEETD